MATTRRRVPAARWAGASRSAYRVYRDGGRIRIVAWRNRRGAYWVSNTLSGRLSNAQMLAVARSLVRVGE